MKERLERDLTYSMHYKSMQCVATRETEKIVSRCTAEAGEADSSEGDGESFFFSLMNPARLLGTT